MGQASRRQKSDPTFGIIPKSALSPKNYNKSTLDGTVRSLSGVEQQEYHKMVYTYESVVRHIYDIKEDNEFQILIWTLIFDTASRNLCKDSPCSPQAMITKLRRRPEFKGVPNLLFAKWILESILWGFRTTTIVISPQHFVRLFMYLTVMAREVIEGTDIGDFHEYAVAPFLWFGLIYLTEDISKTPLMKNNQAEFKQIVDYLRHNSADFEDILSLGSAGLALVLKDTRLIYHDPKRFLIYLESTPNANYPGEIAILSQGSYFTRRSTDNTIKIRPSDIRKMRKAIWSSFGRLGRSYFHGQLDGSASEKLAKLLGAYIKDGYAIFSPAVRNRAIKLGLS